jgi:hypothetical protein
MSPQYSHLKIPIHNPIPKPKPTLTQKLIFLWSAPRAHHQNIPTQLLIETRLLAPLLLQYKNLERALHLLDINLNEMLKLPLLKIHRKPNFDGTPRQ